MNPGAIVLGGNFIGLGVVRSLGARGIPVWIVDPKRSNAVARFSRYAQRFLEPTADVHHFLIREGQRHRLDGWVLFPADDTSVEILSTNHQSLSTIYHVTTPPIDVTKFALDKRLTYRRADELGIPTPWTSTSDAASEAVNDLPYPVILKPAVNHHFFPHTGLKVLAADDPLEFQTARARMGEWLTPDAILVQERIPGGGQCQFSYCAACKQGKVYAALVARRRRQYPVEFGNASSFVETVDQPLIEAYGRKFLEAIGFDGMAEVEFKFDSRDRRYKILDVNARPWGWHALGKAAGIDFSYLVWRQKVGREMTPIPSHKRATWVRELNDFLAIAKSPNRAAEIRCLLGAILRGNLTGATFDLLDPVPFFAEFVLRASQGFWLQRQATAFLSDTR
ncbi:MAG: ATP-grasp domain-containing protein [Acidobacteria bacterium]|nr:MAG: ATP-grasp domain-containing protein [Acidobacteriota bacterium]